MCCCKKIKQMANAVRFLSAEAIEKAKSGHPGMPLGMADVATVLWSSFLKFNPADGRWFNRDRFVLSAGHGSMLLYSLLYLSGFKDISLEDIKNFRQLGSKTAGHPEQEKLSGIDMTTGPLGQGISSAVGMALAERILNCKYGNKLCNHYTYVIAGDGCLMEGISEEAIELAGHLGLNKLIVFWDNNGITIDGKTDIAVSTDQIKRFKASGWNTIKIDGHNPCQISKAVKKAQKSKKPTLIACKTTIGFGAPGKCGSSKCHGSPLGAEELAAMKKQLKWTSAPFEVPAEIMAEWRACGQRAEKEYLDWQNEYAANKEFKNLIEGKFAKGWEKGLESLKTKAINEQIKVATRKASQMCIEQIVPNVKQIIGGSADLNASNLTHTEGMTRVEKGQYCGNEVAYGIREHAMGAIMNGLALHGGFIPFGGTFFVFSDYLRPAVRLGALMGLKVIYVLTHDSIGVGEDGPTHQPIEQLASFRAMPETNVFRPADVVETAESWELAVKSNKPSLLVLSRQNLPMVRNSAKENLTAKGAYIISNVSTGKVRQASIIATGSEVSLAISAQAKLRQEGIEVAVISMPCCALFDKQDAKYKKDVLGLSPRLAVEAAASYGWERYIGENGIFIGMHGFGASAPADKLYEHFGITEEAIIKGVKKLLKGK